MLAGDASITPQRCFSVRGLQTFVHSCAAPLAADSLPDAEPLIEKQLLWKSTKPLPTKSVDKAGRLPRTATSRTARGLKKLADLHALVMREQADLTLASSRALDHRVIPRSTSRRRRSAHRQQSAYRTLPPAGRQVWDPCIRNGLLLWPNVKRE